MVQVKAKNKAPSRQEPCKHFAILWHVWLVLLTGCAVSIWFLYTPYNPLKMPLLQDYTMLISAGSLAITTIILNLIGWALQHKNFNPYILARINLLSIGVVLLWLAACYLLNTINVAHPLSHYQIHHFYNTAAILGAMAFFVWELAFFLPRKLSQLQLSIVIFLCLIALLLCFFISSSLINNNQINLDRTIIFPRRFIFWGTVTLALLLILTLPALYAGHLPLIKENKQASTKITKSHFAIWFAFWGISLVLLVVSAANKIGIPVGRTTPLVLMAFGFILTTIYLLSFFKNFTKQGKQGAPFALASQYANLLGLGLIWMFMAFVGMALAGDPYKQAFLGIAPPLWWLFAGVGVLLLFLAPILVQGKYAYWPQLLLGAITIAVFWFGYTRPIEGEDPFGVHYRNHLRYMEYMFEHVFSIFIVSMAAALLLALCIGAVKSAKKI